MHIINRHGNLHKISARDWPSWKLRGARKAKQEEVTAMQEDKP